jgi:hypothetical protein
MKMSLAICNDCGATIDSRKEHKCPFNVVMTEEDKDKNFTNSK